MIHEKIMIPKFSKAWRIKSSIFYNVWTYKDWSMGWVNWSSKLLYFSLKWPLIEGKKRKFIHPSRNFMRKKNDGS